MKRYFIRLGAVQLITAIGAIPAGLLFVLDPSGARMGTTTSMLADSPFRTFLIPGLFLLLVNGLGNTAGAWFSFTRKSISGRAGVLLGIILCLWITVQVFWIGLTSFLQPLFMLAGSCEIAFGWQIIRAAKNPEKIIRFKKPSDLHPSV